MSQVLGEPGKKLTCTAICKKKNNPTRPKSMVSRTGPRVLTHQWQNLVKNFRRPNYIFYIKIIFSDLKKFIFSHHFLYTKPTQTKKNIW